MSMRSEFDYERTGRAVAGRELDLAGLGRAIASRRWWIIVPALLCFVGAVAFVSLVQPRYTAESKVLVENGESFFTRPDRSDQLSTTLPDDETVQSQIQLIQSRDIARAAIRRLDLRGNVEFDPLARGINVVSRLLILLGLERDPTSVSPEDRMLTAYYERLTVYSVPKSRVIAIEFSATDPDLAARASNTIADLFIQAQSAAKRDSASRAAASLAALVTDLRSRVSDAEAKADAYRTQSGLLQGSNNANISTQQLGDLNGPAGPGPHRAGRRPGQGQDHQGHDRAEPRRRDPGTSPTTNSSAASPSSARPSRPRSPCRAARCCPATPTCRS